MGASEHIKLALKAKGLTQKILAEKLGKPVQTVYNTINRDGMTYTQVERYAEAIGCEVVFRDKETGEIY